MLFGWIIVVVMFINCILVSSFLDKDSNILVNDGYGQDSIIHSKLLTIKDDFTKYLTKFHSQSCLMEVISVISEECDKLSDESISKIAYELTICSFKKIGKRIPLCSQSKPNSENSKNINNINTCLKEFEGDIWTTYSTFTQHIDNLCFFYKSIIWEKSSDFLLMKLANSSLGILNELQSSMQIAHNLFSYQERMSLDLNSNISEAIDKIGNVNKLLDNYSEIESKLKNELNEIESKLKNNIIINNIGTLLDDKGGIMNTFTFFFIYFTILLCVSLLIGEKGKMMLCGIISIGCEVYIVNPRFNGVQHNTIDMIYIKMIVFASRVLYYIIAGGLVVVGLCCKNSKKELNRREMTFSEVKSVLGMTPMWVRKYFSRVENQNDNLAEDFKKMVRNMKNQVDN